MLWDMKLKPPKEKAVTREFEVFEGTVGVVGEDRFGRFDVEAVLTRCRCICKLFASAFSCVRTKLARLCEDANQY